MFEIKNKIIKITKGDSASIKVDLMNDDGTAYTMQTGDTLTFTTRKKPKESVLMQVTSSSDIIELAASQTKNLEAGYCCYDIELKTSNGSVITIAGMEDSIYNMVVYPEITE